MISTWITHLVENYGYYAVFALIALESLASRCRASPR